MFITTKFDATSVNSTLFSLIRTFESGSPAGNYSMVNPSGSGAYGAYQLKPQALEDIGAIEDSTESLTAPGNWTGAFGTSLKDFLSNPIYQDAAAEAYLNNYVVPIVNKFNAPDQIGSTFPDMLNNPVPITQDGLLLAAWNVPGAAISVANGNSSSPNFPQLGTPQYNDTLSRFQAGAIADGELVINPTSVALAKSQIVTDYFGTTNYLISPIALTFDTGDIAWTPATGGFSGVDSSGTQYFLTKGTDDQGNQTAVVTILSSTVSGQYIVNYYSSFANFSIPTTSVTLSGITGPVTLSGGLVSVGGSQPFTYLPLSNQISGQNAVTATVNDAALSLITPADGAPFAVVSSITSTGAASISVQNATPIGGPDSSGNQDYKFANGNGVRVNGNQIVASLTFQPNIEFVTPLDGRPVTAMVSGPQGTLLNLTVAPGASYTATTGIGGSTALTVTLPNGQSITTNLTQLSDGTPVQTLAAIDGVALSPTLVNLLSTQYGITPDAISNGLLGGGESRGGVTFGQDAEGNPTFTNAAGGASATIALSPPINGTITSGIVTESDGSSYGVVANPDGSTTYLSGTAQVFNAAGVTLTADERATLVNGAQEQDLLDGASIVTDILNAIHSGTPLGIATAVDNIVETLSYDTRVPVQSDTYTGAIDAGAVLSVVGAIEDPSAVNITGAVGAVVGALAENSIAGLLPDEIPIIGAVTSFVEFLEQPSVLGGVTTAINTAGAFGGPLFEDIAIGWDLGLAVATFLGIGASSAVPSITASAWWSGNGTVTWSAVPHHVSQAETNSLQTLEGQLVALGQAEGNFIPSRAATIGIDSSGFYLQDAFTGDVTQVSAAGLPAAWLANAIEHNAVGDAQLYDQIYRQTGGVDGENGGPDLLTGGISTSGSGTLDADTAAHAADIAMAEASEATAAGGFDGSATAPTPFELLGQTPDNSAGQATELDQWNALTVPGSLPRPAVGSVEYQAEQAVQTAIEGGGPQTELVPPEATATAQWTPGTSGTTTTTTWLSTGVPVALEEILSQTMSQLVALGQSIGSFVPGRAATIGVDQNGLFIKDSMSGQVTYTTPAGLQAAWLADAIAVQAVGNATLYNELWQQHLHPPADGTPEWVLDGAIQIPGLGWVEPDTLYHQDEIGAAKAWEAYEGYEDQVNDFTTISFGSDGTNTTLTQYQDYSGWNTFFDQPIDAPKSTPAATGGSPLAIVGTGTNVAGLGGSDLFVRAANGDLSFWEVNAAGNMIGGANIQSVTSTGTSPLVIDTGTSVAGAGTNLLGAGGQDLLVHASNGTVEIVEVDPAGTVENAAMVTNSTGAAILIDPTTVITGVGTDLLGGGGQDIVFTASTGQIGVWELQAGTGTVGIQGTEYTLSNGTVTVTAPVAVLGTNDTITVTGAGSVTVDAIYLYEIIDSNNTVVTATAGGDELVVTGGGNTINATTGLANTVIVSGGVDTINQTGGSVTIAAIYLYETINSTNTVITATAGGDELVVTGGGNTINATTGLANTVIVSGGVDTINQTGGSLSIAAIYLYEVINSTNTVITAAAGGDALVVTGRGNTINATGTASSVTVNGSGNTVVVASGSSETITLNGTGNRLVTSAASIDQLTFTQSGTDLVIGIVGTAASYTIKGWFSGLASQFTEIDAADGTSLSLAGAAAFGAALSGPQPSALTSGGTQLVGASALMEPVGTSVLTEPAAEPSLAEVTWQPDTAAINALSLTSNGAAVSLSSLTVLGEGQNLLGLGGNDLVMKDRSGVVHIWEFNSLGQIIQYPTLTWSGAPAAIGGSTIIGEGQDLLGQGGNDLIFRDASGYVDIWEFNSLGQILRPLTLTLNGAYAAIGSSTIIGEGQDLLGEGGGDLIAKDASGDIDIWEFTSLGAIGRAVTLTINNAPAAIGSATIIGEGQDLLGQGGSDLVLKDSSGYVDIWEFNSLGQILRPLGLSWQGASVTLNGSTIVGQGQNLLGQGGSDLVLQDSSGYVDIWEFNSLGQILRPLGLTWQGASVTLNGSTIIGQGQNLLGQGGGDLILNDSSGDVDIWEFNSLGQILRPVGLTLNGASVTLNGATIVGDGQDLFGTGGHDLFFEQNGMLQAWEINNLGAITAVPSSADVQRLVQSMATFGAGTNGTSFGGLGTAAETFIANTWHIATPH